MENIKRCQYRNCVHVIMGKRSDSKFCSRKCKELEKTYRKRENIVEEDRKSEILDLLHEYEKNQVILDDPDLMGLYNKIRKEGLRG